MNKIISIFVFAAILIFTNACNEPTQKNVVEQKVLNHDTTISIYQKAGIIKIRDPKSVMVGYRKQGNDIFEISLDDVGKYTGHVCAGVSSGFLLTKQALELLYNNDEIPVRGNISVVASGSSDQLDVANYVLRLNTNGDESESATPTLFMDTTLTTQQGITILIFKRNDTGKMVKATFDISKLMPKDKMQKMQELKSQVIGGTANDMQKSKFAENIQNAVNKIITDTPEGLITVVECTDYIFKK